MQLLKRRYFSGKAKDLYFTKLLWTYLVWSLWGITLLSISLQPFSHLGTLFCYLLIVANDTVHSLMFCYCQAFLCTACGTWACTCDSAYHFKEANSKNPSELTAAGMIVICGWPCFIFEWNWICQIKCTLQFDQSFMVLGQFCCKLFAINVN